MTSNFSHETFEVRRNWHTIFQALKEKNCQPRFLYLVKIPFSNKGKIQTFSDEENQPLKTAKGSSLYIKKMIIEGGLAFQKGKIEHENG